MQAARHQQELQLRGKENLGNRNQIVGGGGTSMSMKNGRSGHAVPAQAVPQPRRTGAPVEAVIDLTASDSDSDDDDDDRWLLSQAAAAVSPRTKDHQQDEDDPEIIDLSQRLSALTTPSKAPSLAPPRSAAAAAASSSLRSTNASSSATQGSRPLAGGGRSSQLTAAVAHRPLAPTQPVAGGGGRSSLTSLAHRSSQPPPRRTAILLPIESTITSGAAAPAAAAPKVYTRLTGAPTSSSSSSSSASTVRAAAVGAADPAFAFPVFAASTSRAKLPPVDFAEVRRLNSQASLQAASREQLQAQAKESEEDNVIRLLRETLRISDAGGAESSKAQPQGQHNGRPQEGRVLAASQLAQDLTVTLLPYQLDGVKWMIDTESNAVKGGILADDMGLGKTVRRPALFLRALSSDQLAHTCTHRSK
jgi:hypothetical protein